MQLETENNYILKASSAFIDNNPNVNCYCMLISKSTLHENTLTSIITNNSDNKVCIPKEIKTGTSEGIKNDRYRINDITFTARDNDLKIDAQTFLTQKASTVYTHIKDNTLRQSKTFTKIPNYQSL